MLTKHQLQEIDSVSKTFSTASIFCTRKKLIAFISVCTYFVLFHIDKIQAAVEIFDSISILGPSALVSTAFGFHELL